MKAYYFSQSNKKLRYNDNREIAEGVTHEVMGLPVLCEHGLHASIKALDALKYAPGLWLWVVELSGEIIYGEDKCVAQKRTYIKGFDATELLREFARKCAMLNIEKIKPYCNDKDYNIIIHFLETGKNPKAALSAANAAENAVYAAYDAAAYAAYYAVYAAYDAAVYAANAAENAAENAVYAAYDAAENAVYAAYDAAYYAAYYDAADGNELNTMLEKMIEKKLNLK